MCILKLFRIIQALLPGQVVGQAIEKLASVCHHNLSVSPAEVHVAKRADSWHTAWQLQGPLLGGAEEQGRRSQRSSCESAVRPPAQQVGGS